MSIENKKPKNPQAFPLTWEQNGTTDNWENGMTLRDYFAAKAMAAFISSSDSETSCTDIVNGVEGISDMAYKVADEMLKTREYV